MPQSYRYYIESDPDTVHEISIPDGACHAMSDVWLTLIRPHYPTHDSHTDTYRVCDCVARRLQEIAARYDLQETIQRRTDNDDKG